MQHMCKENTDFSIMVVGNDEEIFWVLQPIKVAL